MPHLLAIAQYIVLALSYIGLGIGHLPGFRMNRATIALVGSAFLIGLGVLSLETAWEAIDPNTIVFLLGMMVVNANLAYAGFFQFALAPLLRLTSSPFSYPDLWQRHFIRIFSQRYPGSGVYPVNPHPHPAAQGQ